MKNIYPLKLKAVTKDSIWGGDKLSREYGIRSDNPKIAEAWLLTVREDGMSVIENGDYSGKTLRDYFNSEEDSAICEDFSLDRFPLLIKFIDAKDDLSIQVHPDDNYAIPHENEFGKTEMWYIVEAEPDARIVYGLRPGVSHEDFCRAVDSGCYDGLLNYIPVRAGEVYFIPSGLVHAICRGILIAEIQQNSNITYRVYDYDRRGKDGKPRQLHTEKAKEVVSCLTEDDIAAQRFSRRKADDPTLLAASRYFTVCKLDVSGRSEQRTVTSKSFQSLICLSGTGTLLVDGDEYTIQKGDSFFLPAGLGDYTLSAERALSVLVSSVK